MKFDIFGIVNVFLFCVFHLTVCVVYSFADTTHFHTRKSLLYSYVGETITGLVGTSGDLSGLKLSAKCKITPVLPCTYMLQVNTSFQTKF